MMRWLSFLLTIGCLTSSWASQPQVTGLEQTEEQWVAPTHGVKTTTTEMEGMKVSVDDPRYTLNQRTLMFSAPITRVLFSGEIKTQHVVDGTKPINKARAQLEWLNAEGNQVGSWPEGTNQGGSQEWTSFAQEHRTPEGTTGVRVHIGVYGTTGDAWFRQLQLQAFDAEGQPLEPLVQEAGAKNRSGWWVYEPGEPLEGVASILDFSPYFAQDQQVGVKGEEFTLPSGQPIRFWGTNVGPAEVFAEKGEIDVTLDRLARYGTTMVRLHHLDRGWHPQNIFARNVPDTQAFNPEYLDRMGYFIAGAAKRGMTVYLDLLVTRKFRVEDGVQDWQKLEVGAKIACHFNPRLIELQKDYAKKLLEYVNPYTGKALKDDAAIAMLEIVNESTMFWKTGYLKLPESYHTELRELFTRWCEEQGKTQPKGNWVQLLEQRNATAYAFLEDIQDKYYAEMSEFLRQEVGYAGLIGGSNHWENHARDLRSNAKLDFIDRHSYWDTPQGGWSDRDVFHNRSMTRQLANEVNHLTFLAKQRVAGLPFIVTEWQNCWPNDWITEGPMLMALYGGLQNWNGLLQFQLLEPRDEFGRWGYQPNTLRGSFAFADKPHVYIPYAVASLVFLRGDIAAGKPMVFPAPQGAMEQTGLGAGIANPLILKNKVSGEVDVADGNEQKAPNFLLRKQEVIQSSTGELVWHQRGAVEVRAARTQGLLGFIGEDVITLPNVEMQVKTPFAQVMLVALEKAPLKQAKRILVLATARAENTNAKYRPGRKGLVDPGVGPVLLEPVKASVTLKRAEETAALSPVPSESAATPEADSAAPMGSKQDGFLFRLAGWFGFGAVSEGEAKSQASAVSTSPTLRVLNWYGQPTERTLPVTENADGSLSFELGSEPAYWFILELP